MVQAHVKEMLNPLPDKIFQSTASTVLVWDKTALYIGVGFGGLVHGKKSLSKILNLKGDRPSISSEGLSIDDYAECFCYSYKATCPKE